LTELAIYINEVDVEFVRKAIKAIGKIALRYEKSIERYSLLLKFIDVFNC
jgi:AP-1 complex subunit beta-1